MNKKALIVTIMATMFLLLPIVADSVAAESSDLEITTIKQGDHATLTINAIDGETIIWDLGDGRVRYGSTVDEVWQSGFYHLKAAIISSSGDINVLQKPIGFYDEHPPTSALKNNEYRYCVYFKETPTITDDVGNNIAWLSYDHNLRIISGIPKETGSYNVNLNADRDNNERFTIGVIDSTTAIPWVNFNATVNNSTVTAEPNGSADNSIVRYSWTLTDHTKKLISGYEGKNLSLSVEDSGIYILKLQMTGPSGTANYSQIIEVNSVADPLPEPQNYSGIAIVFAIFTGIFLIITIIFKNEMSALAAMISAISALLMVLK